MKQPSDPFFQNNFDLVRLIAASQVMIFHSFSNFVNPMPLAGTLINYAPGVPAFFFVSGFLISASYERNDDLKNYTVNRVLRIFPALFGVLAFSLLTLFAFFDHEKIQDNTLTLVAWCIAQVTFLQSWNPEFLRDYGIGVMNGSLWTIPVELSFYIAIPLIYWLTRRVGHFNFTVLMIMTSSFSLQYWLYIAQTDLLEIAFKALNVSPFPWIGMFCMGILAQKHLPSIHKLVAGRFLGCLTIFVSLAILSTKYPLYPFLSGSGNSLGVANYLALCLLILSGAYTKPSLAGNLLKRNDISYGIYIFHAPVINALFHLGATGISAAYLAIGFSIVLGAISWFLIEKPALKLKQWALYRH